MIETVVNIIQLIITGACSGIALFNAVRTEHRAWTLVGLFSGIFFMGDLYWLLFLPASAVTATRSAMKSQRTSLRITARIP